MPRKQIKELITELRTWLPDYEDTQYANSFYRILASLPGGDELEDMGYEPLPDINWREAEQIARVLTAVENERDLKDLIAGLMNEEEGEVGEMSEAPHRPRSVAWKVTLDGKEIDTVFFDPSMTADDVKQSLIHHDGYQNNIHVSREHRANRVNETVAETTRRAPANEDAARELALYTINDGDIYRQTIQPIIKNLAKKVRNGTYNAEKAVQAWSYAADAGAQKYTKELGGSGNGSYGSFSKADRMAAAKEIGEHFEEEVQTAAQPDRRLNEAPVVSKSDPKVYLSFSEDRYRVINQGVPISPDKSTAAEAVAVAKHYGLYISDRMWDGSADPGSWVPLSDHYNDLPPLHPTSVSRRPAKRSTRKR